jgi:hypothetical protein
MVYVTGKDLSEIRCESVDWIHLAQARVPWRVDVKTVIKDGEFLD